LIVILYRTGLRISEALDLEPRDLGDQTIRVRHGKGDQCRVVGVDAGAWAVLQSWIRARPAGLTLFCTLKGAQIKTQYVRKLLHRLAEKAGIEKRVHPHGLRHTFAFELVSEGVPIHIISKQLGHRNISTTDIYLRHLNPAVVVDAMKGREFSL
jgi:site-specific recombinase XerD